jgi:hypothetical protein
VSSTIDVDRTNPSEIRTSNELPASTECIEALDKPMVADLMPIQISRMTCEELARAIRASGLPIIHTALNERLKLYDRTTLERLVYRARQCCRNQGY